MKSKGIRRIAIVTSLAVALGAGSASAQDKYAQKVPGGLAFSEYGDTKTGRSSRSARTDHWWPRSWPIP